MPKFDINGPTVALGVVNSMNSIDTEDPGDHQIFFENLWEKTGEIPIGKIFGHTIYGEVMEVEEKDEGTVEYVEFDVKTDNYIVNVRAYTGTKGAHIKAEPHRETYSSEARDLAIRKPCTIHEALAEEIGCSTQSVTNSIDEEIAEWRDQVQKRFELSDLMDDFFLR